MATTGPIRLGVLGAGRILERFLPGAQRSSAIELAAIASRDPERALRFAGDWGFANTFATYDALLADPDVDGVYICLPNSLHHHWTMRSLAAGKHVICEKPYSTDPTEVDAAHDRADAAGLVLTEGFMWRHGPHAQRFVEELPRIGDLRTIRSTFSFNIASETDIRLSRELAGGSLMDVGTYCVSASRLIAGREPIAATAIAWPAPSGVDERFSGILDFGDGVVADADVRVSQRPRGHGGDRHGRVVAPGRSVHRPGDDAHRAGRFRRRSRRSTRTSSSWTTSRRRSAASIRRVSVARTPLGQARTLAALYESAATGAVVAI